ncbi:hypothetical protein K501DRAFT_124240, partial [Backusella circina FSU 941]
NDVCQRLRTVEPLAIEYDTISSTIYHHFDIVESSDLLDSGNRALLGRDLISQLGISFTNVAFKFKNKDLRSIDDSIIDQPYIPNVTPAGPPNQQEAFQKGIKRYLNENEQLNPHSFCNHPESIVHLPTPPSKFVHVRQYPLPYAMQPAIMKEINRLLDDGIIMPAP